jgi:hypothetical protein
MYMYFHVYCLYKKLCLYLQPHQAPIHMCMYEYVFACIIHICIYMPICMYICMYMYVCVCIPFGCYNNTTFDHFCMKPQLLSGRYRLICLGRQVFELQLRQRHFIPALFCFCTENYPPVTSRRTGFSVEPGVTSKICIQAHTCKYIHIQPDTYQYMQMHAHTCNTSRYRWIHIYTYMYIHIQLLVDANTDTYIYKQYRHIQTDMSRYKHFAHTYTYRQYIHIYTHTCRYKIWTTYDF